MVTSDFSFSTIGLTGLLQAASGQGLPDRQRGETRQCGGGAGPGPDHPQAHPLHHLPGLPPPVPGRPGRGAQQTQDPPDGRQPAQVGCTTVHITSTQCVFSSPAKGARIVKPVQRSPSFSKPGGPPSPAQARPRPGPGTQSPSRIPGASRIPTPSKSRIPTKSSPRSQVNIISSAIYITLMLLKYH